MNIGDIVAHLKLDMSNFSQGINQATGSVTGLGGTMQNSLSSVSSNVKALVMQNMSVIGQQIGQTGKNIMSWYSDMIQTTSDYSAEVEQQKFVYENLSKEIQRAINDHKGLANSLGMTEQQYMNNTTSIMSFLENAGMAPDIISKQSEAITQLTADMGAFANVPVDTAVSDFKSALMGNFQVLDKYGINMNVATINTSDYAKQLGKTWDKMTEGEKKQAILNEMYRQSADYTGLASQEAGSFAMQLNLLKARIGETVAKIGEQLLPVLEPLIQKISDVVLKLAEWIEEHPKLTQFLVILGGAIGVLMAVIGPLISLFASLSAIATALGVSIGAVCAPIALVAAAIVGLIAIGWLLYDNWDTIGQHFNTIWEGIKGVFSGALTFIKGLLNGDYELMKQGATEWGEGMWNIFTGAWELIKAVFNGACEFIKGIFTDWYNTLDSDTQAWIDGILESLTGMWESLKSIFEGFLDIIKGIWEGDWTLISEGGQKIWDGIKEWFINVWELLKDTVFKKASEIKNEAINKFNELKDKAIEKLQDMKDKAVRKIQDLKDEAIRKVQQLKDDIVKKITDAKDEFVRKVGDMKDKAVDKIEKLPGEMVKALSGLAGDLKEAGRNAVQGLIDGLDEKLKAVREKAADIAEAVSGAVKNLLKIKSPSRVMRDEVGRFIPEGIAVGIDKNTYKAVDSAKDLASNLVSSVDLKPLQATVTSTDIRSHNANTRSNTISADGVAIVQGLKDIFTAIKDTKDMSGLNVVIEEFNNHTDEDINSLMQRMEAQIRLNNLGKGLR